MSDRSYFQSNQKLVIFPTRLKSSIIRNIHKSISITNILFIYSLIPDPAIASFARSEVQECAISIGLLMFGIILERFIQLLKESLSSSNASNANKSASNVPILTLSGNNAEAVGGKKQNNSSSDK